MINQAVILCGGKGTRIRELYDDRPKGMIPVHGKPFIEWQVQWLARQDIQDILLSTGYMAEAFEEFAEDMKDANLSITCHKEPQPLGTAGGVKWMEPHIYSYPILVLNGDSLLPRLNLREMTAAHEEQKGIRAMLAVTHITECGRYGTVEFDASHRITAFREKTEREEGWVNGGVYIFDHAVVEAIKPNQNCSLETDIFPELSTQSCIRAFPCPGPLLDMGTPEGLEAMRRFLAQDSTFC